MTPMNRLRSFILARKDRMRKILLLSDLHATRITLATAELLMFNDVWSHPYLANVQDMLQIMPSWLWMIVLGVTGLLQCFFIIRGHYHEKDAVAFAGWNALLWIFMTAIVVVRDSVFPGPLLALTFSASWVFMRSGFPVHGNRSSDYAEDRRYRERR